MLNITARTATLSDDGRYRYDLTRTWEPPAGEIRRGRALFVMLNPSTADAEVDDPTIRRCMGFADREGCGELAVVNLYAFRTSKPAELWAARDSGIDIVGPLNRHTIARHAAIARTTGSPIIAAWGSGVPAGAADVRQVLKVLGDAGVKALGLTKDGHPRHPLYVKGDAPLVPFEASA